MASFRVGATFSWDRVLALCGLLGIAHETIMNHGAERPYLLAVFVLMLGLPLPAALDRFRK